VATVRERYGAIATGATSSCCPTSSGGCTTDTAAISARLGYAATDLELLPAGTNLGLGCGAPVALLDLKPGETVLDLGSGAGIDVFLAARRVGPSGRAIGVDMTPEMVEKARANAVAVGLDQVDIRLGRLEALPVEDASVDAVTSNCVINLVPDKAAVFGEVARVLRPGGRLVVADIVLDAELPPAVASDLLAHVGCVAGAMQRSRYFALLQEAGFARVEVLKDVDFLELELEALPEEVEALLARTGATVEQLRGIVRSLTYRAVRG